MVLVYYRHHEMIVTVLWHHGYFMKGIDDMIPAIKASEMYLILLIPVLIS